MKDYLISPFIDDELTLEDKIDFVNEVGGSEVFKEEAIELLKQEKRIRSPIVDHVPGMQFKVRRSRFPRYLYPAGLLGSAVAAAVAIFLLIMSPHEARTFPHRFVIYQPEVEKVEIAGSFTQWQTVPMNRIGSSGYWDLILDLPRGEHRFTYLLEGNRRIVDPTVPTREKDDFGGENSVLSVES